MKVVVRNVNARRLNLVMMLEERLICLSSKKGQCLILNIKVLIHHYKYAIESQVKHHGFDPKEAMILLEPLPGSGTLTADQILSAITEHADSTALIVLPGIQYYTGQYFDIEKITAHAHSHGILIGWDCAHAAGNVDLKLHDWNVDFAVWCNYKYLNSGPGAIAGLFVHDKHGAVDMAALEKGEPAFRPRLSGWWGGNKGIRFRMEPCRSSLSRIAFSADME
jgi:kynureninase